MEARRNYVVSLDDDPIVHKIIGRILNVPVVPFRRVETFRAKASSYKPSAFFCDINLGEGISGMDLIEESRRNWPGAAIFIMTASSDDRCIGQALALGADDFLQKPLSTTEVRARMLARIKELRSIHQATHYVVGDVIIDRIHNTLQKGSKVTHLSKLESRLFTTLTDCPGSTLARPELKGHLWGKLTVSDNALDKKISNLRGSLRQIGSELEVKTLYGSGICISSPDELKSTNENAKDFQ